MGEPSGRKRNKADEGRSKTYYCKIEHKAPAAQSSYFREKKRIRNKIISFAVAIMYL